MNFGRYTGGATGINLSGLGAEFLEEIGIEIMNSLVRNIEATARHLAISTSEIDCSLFGFWAHNTLETHIFKRDRWILSLLPMKRASLQVGIEFYFLKTAGR